VNQVWGSWFAYRVVVLADTEFEPTSPLTAASPCHSCTEKPCLSACPAEALEHGDFSLKLCIDYRLREHSQCKAQCLARLACPIAPEHRYSMEQINYHYGRSMQTIEEYNR
jgi:epoxyqueuosine reductase QueG